MLHTIVLFRYQRHVQTRGNNIPHALVQGRAAVSAPNNKNRHNKCEARRGVHAMELVSQCMKNH